MKFGSRAEMDSGASGDMALAAEANETDPGACGRCSSINEEIVDNLVESHGVEVARSAQWSVEAGGRQEGDA